MRRRSTPLLAVALATAGVVLGTATPPSAMSAPAGGAPTVAAVAAPSVSRITGADRYAMSAAASRAAFPLGTTAPVVYLVSGTSPWESLSATPAAVRQGGAVLLTRPDGIPPDVATELARLSPDAIVVVGSTASISDAVLSQARSYAATVQRVAGATRYLTAQALVRHAFPAGEVTTAWIATGTTWTDALVGGVAAASRRAPLLTVDGSATTLPATTVDLIRDLGLTSVTVVGGPVSVSSGIEAQLRGLLGATAVSRASGADRYAAAAQINRLAFPSLSTGSAHVATGRGFVDALAGGFLAGRTKRPLFYSQPYCVPESVRPSLLAASVTSVVLLGGEASVRSTVGSLTSCRSIDAASSLWVLVNKRNPLSPKTYLPSSLVVPSVSYPNGQRLRSDAAAAVATMFSAARAEGAGRMSIASGYRSYSTQYSVYWNRVSTHGQAYADVWIARPGYSEHQTGLGLDVAPVGNASCSSYTCIGSTPQGAWLKRNAWRFGFVIRYESGYTSWTGYNSEPWHLRFVGGALSAGYHRGGWHTLEQFFGEPAAPTY